MTRYHITNTTLWKTQFHGCEREDVSISESQRRHHRRHLSSEAGICQVDRGEGVILIIGGSTDEDK